ncbi:MAG: ribbon-helix-helix domain-containing protein [Acidobacteriota bacterium]|nr:ribbon-helix-helix domain-containing protein [Acidobacteriota bacterium]
MPTSVRLDAKTQLSLEQLADRRGQTKSEVVRQAIELLAARERQPVFEAVSDLIGSVTGGPDDLSEHTGRKLAEILALKKP